MHDPYVVAFEIKRPWPSSYKTKTGRRRYWPAMITVWHREPGGHDSGTVCKRSAWKYHVHHWKIQVRPLQRLRRWTLTRCAWCGGRSRKDDVINIGSSWNGVRSPWWRGERDLRHHDCDTVWRASRKCLCDSPLLSGDGHGECAFCGKYRSWGQGPNDADRLLASIPEGGRIPVEMRPKLEAVWHPILREQGVDPATTKAPW